MVLSLSLFVCAVLNTLSEKLKSCFFSSLLFRLKQLFAYKHATRREHTFDTDTHRRDTQCKEREEKKINKQTLHWLRLSVPKKY